MYAELGSVLCSVGGCPSGLHKRSPPPLDGQTGSVATIDASSKSEDHLCRLANSWDWLVDEPRMQKDCVSFAERVANDLDGPFLGWARDIKSDRPRLGLQVIDGMAVWCGILQQLFHWEEPFEAKCLFSIKIRNEYRQQVVESLKRQLRHLFLVQSLSTFVDNFLFPVIFERAYKSTPSLARAANINVRYLELLKSPPTPINSHQKGPTSRGISSLIWYFSSATPAPSHRMGWTGNSPGLQTGVDPHCLHPICHWTRRVQVGRQLQNRWKRKYNAAKNDRLFPSPVVVGLVLRVG